MWVCSDVTTKILALLGWQSHIIFYNLHFYVLRALYGYPWRCHMNFDVLAQIYSVFMHYYNTHIGFYVFCTFGSLGSFFLTLGPCWIHVSSSIHDLITCFVIVSRFLHHFTFSAPFSYHSIVVFRLGLSFGSQSMEH